MKRLRQPSADELRLALPHGATKLFGCGFLQRYQRLRPQTKVRIVEQGSAANRRTVLEGGVDAAMAYEPEQSPELSIEPLLWEKLVVVGPARTPAGRPIDYPDSYQPADLARLPLLLPVAPHGYRRIVERVIQPLRIEPNVVLEVDGLPALATLVEEGMGMMVSTLAVVEASVAAGTIARRASRGARLRNGAQPDPSPGPGHVACPADPEERRRPRRRGSRLLVQVPPGAGVSRLRPIHRHGRALSRPSTSFFRRVSRRGCPQQVRA